MRFQRKRFQRVNKGKDSKWGEKDRIPKGDHKGIEGKGEEGKGEIGPGEVEETEERAGSHFASQSVREKPWAPINRKNGRVYENSRTRGRHGCGSTGNGANHEARPRGGEEEDRRCDANNMMRGVLGYHLHGSDGE